MPRVPRPVVYHLAVVVETFHVAVVTRVRSPSLAAAAARAPRRRRHASLRCWLLSLLREAPPLLHLWHIAGTCVARAHACVRYGA